MDSEADALTMAALNDPQVGDRFHEMYSFWLYVVARDGDTVTTMEGSPPVTFPDEAAVRVQSLAEFVKRMSYGSIPGSWVRLRDRGNDVAGWIPAKPEKAMTRAKCPRCGRECHTAETVRAYMDSHAGPRLSTEAWEAREAEYAARCIGSGSSDCAEIVNAALRARLAAADALVVESVWYYDTQDELERCWACDGIRPLHQPTCRLAAYLARRAKGEG